jgi:hypothetical protein
MSIFWQEYLFFIVSSFAILVCLSAAFLFYLIHKVEHQLRTAWRMLGFLLLAIAFFVYVLERKFLGTDIGFALGLTGVIIEFFGFFSIFKGIWVEPGVSHLKEISGIRKLEVYTRNKKLKESVKNNIVLPRIIFYFVSFLVLFALIYIILGKYTPSIIEFFTVIVSVGIVSLQIRRYFKEKQKNIFKKQNLIVTFSNGFLLLRALFFAIDRLPASKIVIIYNAALKYSLFWQLGLICMFLGILFNAIWIWDFIKLRFFVRTFVVLLALSVLVSSLGTLVFSVLIFKIVERDNLNLMSKAIESQNIVFEENLNNSLFLSRLIAENDIIVEELINNDFSDLNKKLDDYFEDINCDLLRLINAKGEIVYSGGNKREKGEIIRNDDLLRYVLIEKKGVKSFDTQPGVLAPIILARSLYPIIYKNKVIGVIESGFIFDNAFVDYLKNKSGLDITFFANIKRSSTTIITHDNVSRWIGSNITNQEIIEKVINKGEDLKLADTRLSRDYYSAYKPLRNFKGKIIGMIAVGTPTIVLLNSAKQQLITSFLIVTIISILAAILGYHVFKLFEKKYFIKLK